MFLVCAGGKIKMDSRLLREMSIEHLSECAVGEVEAR